MDLICQNKSNTPFLIRGGGVFFFKRNVDGAHSFSSRDRQYKDKLQWYQMHIYFIWLRQWQKNIAFHSSGIILYINNKLNLANRYHRFQTAKGNIWFRPIQEQHSKITFECPHYIFLLKINVCMLLFVCPRFVLSCGVIAHHRISKYISAIKGTDIHIPPIVETTASHWLDGKTT